MSQRRGRDENTTAADRHGDKIAALRRAILDSDAVTDRATRSAAAGLAALRGDS